MAATVDLSAIFNPGTTTGGYYSYAGSLTTPGCNEIVPRLLLSSVNKAANKPSSKIMAFPIPFLVSVHSLSQ